MNIRRILPAAAATLAAGISFGLGASSARPPQDAPPAATALPALRHVPAAAAVLAHADLRAWTRSALHQRLLAADAYPAPPAGLRRQLRTRTGIRIEDIGQVTAALVPDGPDSLAFIALLTGDFDRDRTEARVLAYGGGYDNPDRAVLAFPGEGDALAFLAPDTIAAGSHTLVRMAVDNDGSEPTVTDNAGLTTLLRRLEHGSTAWAVALVDPARQRLPIPSGTPDEAARVDTVAIDVHADAGLRATIISEASDETTANHLRDVMRGALALFILQGSMPPHARDWSDTIRIGGTGADVRVRIDLSADDIVWMHRKSFFPPVW